MLTYNGKILSYNNKWIEHPVPDFNPLNLPLNTMRVLFKDGATPKNYEGQYDPSIIWTQLTESPNVWDVYSTKWNKSWVLTDKKGPMYGQLDALKVLGANLEGVTDLQACFMGCSSLDEVCLFDTRAVTNMWEMFESTNITTVPAFPTSNVTNMSRMFEYCYYLESVPMFDTSNVTNMSSMFGDCSNLEEVPLFNTSKCESFDGMFMKCSKLKFVPAFDMSKARDVQSMCERCSALEYFYPQNIGSNTNGLQYLGEMFDSCGNLKYLPTINTTNVTNWTQFAWGCGSVTSVPNYDMSAAQSIYGMLMGTAITEIPDFNFTSAMQGCSHAFRNCYNVQTGILRAYNKLSQYVANDDHEDTFLSCGSNTVTGAAELAQIPSDWGGTGA